MNPITVDFIIPTIEPRKEYLKRCLTCIENITVPSGVEIVKNPIVICGAKSAGAQRNEALAQSQGDYIYFLDDDDIVLHHFFNSRMIDYLQRNEPAVFFGSERFVQPEENDLKDIRPDNMIWRVGRTYRTTVELSNAVTPHFNPYPVGSYILRKDFREIRWPEEWHFGEDIGYNKRVCVELSRKTRAYSYIDEILHIVVRHPLSTTWYPKKPRNMRWHLDHKAAI